MEFWAFSLLEQECSTSQTVAAFNCGIDQRANLECNNPEAVMVAELNGETESLTGWREERRRG